jgi:integrase
VIGKHHIPSYPTFSSYNPVTLSTVRYLMWVAELFPICFPTGFSMYLDRNAVRALPTPKEGERRVFDEELVGFGVRLRAGGKRTWFIQYRVAGKQTTYTLGDVEKIDPAKARAEAKSKLAMAQLGTDPQATKAGARAGSSNTLAKVSDLYLDHVRESTKPATAEAIERSLTKHWAPLRSTPLAQITLADVAAQLKVIKSERGPIAANRGRAYLSGLYSWAMGEGIATANPTVAANRFDEEPRDRKLSDTELVEIWNAAGGDTDYGRIVRLLILTGQRKSEVGSLGQSELDLGGRLWTVPRERTKNGNANEIPLSDPALKILRAAVSDAGDRPMLFGRLGTGFSGWSKAKVELDGAVIEARAEKAKAGKAAKLIPWTIHDLRRTFSTGLAEQGVPPHIIETILNHVSGHKAGVAGIYNRATYRPEVRQALDRWAAHVESLVAGKRGSVVAMKRGG